MDVETKSGVPKRHQRKTVDRRRSVVSSGRLFERYAHRRDGMSDDDVTFIASIADMYKGTHRAEDRKQYLSTQLPNKSRTKTSVGSYIFCTPEDCETINLAVACVKQKTDTAGNELIAQTIEDVRCRIRTDGASDDHSEWYVVDIIRSLCTSFNRLTYTAKARHYCSKDAETSKFLKDKLIQQCDDTSELNANVYNFVRHVGARKYRDLSVILTGIICQTAHIWCRSIRLMERLQSFLQDAFLKVFLDLDINLELVFEPPYHPHARKLECRVRTLPESAFRLSPGSPIRISEFRNTRTNWIRPSAVKRKRSAQETGAVSDTHVSLSQNCPTPPTDIFIETSDHEADEHDNSETDNDFLQFSPAKSPVSTIDETTVASFRMHRDSGMTFLSDHVLLSGP
uniref:Protein UL34 n=1 Tax=Hipposideros bat herpesvirus TaxID=3141919 RepID=A0AAU7E1Y3_9VIRU